MGQERTDCRKYYHCWGSKKEQEKYTDLEKSVEKVLTALDIGNIDYRQVQRKKNQTIQVKLVREKDRVRVLMAKKKLRNIQELKDVYINPELTFQETVKEQKLREAAKDWKTTNPDIKYYIKRGHLTVTFNNETKKYGVNEDGLVQLIEKGQ